MPADLNELALPMGPQRIFDTVIPLILEFVPPKNLLLGGGTALAARWQHRDSADIDLFTSDTTYVQTIYRESARFKTRFEELPGARMVTIGPKGCTLYLHDGTADIVAALPQTEHERSKDCTRDPHISLETNLEILAKKLHQRMIAAGTIVPRDLYDMAVARFLEPETMDAAWTASPVMDSDVLVAALSSFGPGWMERHEEPVVNPRYPALRDRAVQDMLDDVQARFPRIIAQWSR